MRTLLPVSQSTTVQTDELQLPTAGTALPYQGAGTTSAILSALKSSIRFPELFNRSLKAIIANLAGIA